MSGDPDFQAFITSLAPVRKEFESFLLGNRALYADDREESQKLLTDTSSPQQFMETLKTMGHIAEARYNNMNYRYKRLFGGQDFEAPFSPEAVAAGKKLGVNLPSGSTPYAPMGGTQAAPVPGAKTVKMRSPDGDVADIPEEDVEAFEKLGAKRVQ